MLGLSNGTTLNAPLEDIISVTFNGCPAKCGQQG